MGLLGGPLGALIACVSQVALDLMVYIPVTAFSENATSLLIKNRPGLESCLLLPRLQVHVDR